MTKHDDLPHDIHDRGYKHLLSFWKIFQQLIEGYVDEEWKNRLDFQKSERIEKTFILEEFAKKESDVLYKVPLLGTEREVYLYILIEHQSTVDFSMAFRVMTYLVRFWTEYYKNSDENLRTQKGFRFPPVFPIVLYNGEGAWTAATSLRELVEQGDLFTEYIPNVRYHLVDIPRISKEMLKEIGNVLAGVFLLEHEIHGEEFSKAFQEALDLFDRETDDEIWKAVAEWLSVLLRRRHPLDAVKLMQEIDFTKHNRQEVKTMLATMPEKLIAYGEQKGIAKSIIRVLKTRFGEVPQDIIEQLGKIEIIEKLDTLLEQATLVNNLQEFQDSIH